MRGTWHFCNLLVCLYKIIIVNLYVLNNYNILSSTAQDGISPLYIASQNGHTQTVELLLREGADPNLTDKVCGLVWSLYLLHVLLINPRRACARVTVLVLSVCLCVCVCFPYSGTSRNQAYKQQYQRLQRDTGMKYKKGFFFKTLRSEVMASFTHLE